MRALKIFVLDRSPGHLELILDKLPALIVKRFVLDKLLGCLKPVPVPQLMWTQARRSQGRSRPPNHISALKDVCPYPPRQLGNLSG